MGIEQSLRRQVHSYGRVTGVLAASGRLTRQASQRGQQQRGHVTREETGQVSPGMPAVNAGWRRPYLGLVTVGRGSEPELASGGSESAGPLAPGEITTRVQVGTWSGAQETGRPWPCLEDWG